MDNAEIDEKWEVMKSEIRDLRSKSDLSAGLAAEQIKNGVSEILHAALSGKDETLRYEKSYIRWGLVEKRIHAEIDKALNIRGG